MCFFSNTRCAIHALPSSTSRPRRWRCRLRPPRPPRSLASLHLLADAMDLVGPRTAVIDQAEFGLGLAQQKSMLLAAGAGRAVPQDLRAGTQHRPMEMRRAGIAFITWQHVRVSSVPLCNNVYRFHEGCICTQLTCLAYQRLDKTSAVRSLIDDAGGTKYNMIALAASSNPSPYASAKYM